MALSDSKFSFICSLGLTIKEDIGLKINYSILARELEVDRHTVKKYITNPLLERKKRVYTSIYDQYYDFIKDTIEINRGSVTMKGIESLIKFSYPDYKGTYSGLKNYIRRNKLLNSYKSNYVVHPRFETDKGQQLQVDWKEDVKILYSDGKEDVVNFFSCTLGYSRKHYFILVRSKTRDDFLRSLDLTFRRMGGLPKEILTDNMVAIMKFVKSKRFIYPNVKAYLDDVGVNLRLCKPRSPNTKGKCESANRFLNRIQAFNGRIKDFDELIKVTEFIENEVNNTPIEGIGITPNTLFKLEKEYFSPLSKKINISSYLSNRKSYVPDSTGLISVEGKKYSVPIEYINKELNISISEDKKLSIYHEGKIIASHDMKTSKIHNYLASHYTNYLKQFNTHKEDDDLEETAKHNIELLR